MKMVHKLLIAMRLKKPQPKIQAPAATLRSPDTARHHAARSPVNQAPRGAGQTTRTTPSE